MSNWLIVAIVIGPAIAVGTYGVIAVQRRQRVLAYRGWAADNGLTYTRRDDRWVRAYDWGRPFGVGSGRRAIDVIAGAWRGRPAVVFTYRYTTRSNGPGDSTSTDHHYSALYTITLRRPLPTLRVRPYGLFTPPVQGFAWPAADVLRMFLSVYEVRCDVPAFVSDVIDPAMAWWLMSTAAPGFTVVGDRLFVVFGRRVDIGRIAYWLDYLGAVLDRIPASVGAG
jgi:hypothetical protein